MASAAIVQDGWKTPQPDSVLICVVFSGYQEYARVDGDAQALAYIRDVLASRVGVVKVTTRAFRLLD